MTVDKTRKSHHCVLLLGLVGAIFSPQVLAGGVLPVWELDAPQPRGDALVLQNGMVIEMHQKPVRVLGPMTPGEPVLQGSFVLDLLPLVEKEIPTWRESETAAPRGSDHKPVLVDIPPSERFVVVLDPGHGGPGGKENGAVGPHGLKEKKVTLEIALLVRAELQKLSGVEVVMTRERDEEVSMAERVQLANMVRCDLFVSIHSNGNTHAWYRGLETFFHSAEASNDEARRVALDENTRGGEGKPAPVDAVASILQDMHRAEVLRDSSRMAHLVHERLLGVLGFPNHGVMQADFYVLRLTRMPAVLLEIGFITNPVEEKAVRDAAVQQKTALAVRDAIVAYREMMEQKQVRADPSGQARRP